jgi:hypothetical protein
MTDLRRRRSDSVDLPMTATERVRTVDGVLPLLFALIGLLR